MYRACELLERLGYDEDYTEWSFEFSGNLADLIGLDTVSDIQTAGVLVVDVHAGVESHP